MPKQVVGLLTTLLILLLACQQPIKTEREEAAFWKSRFVDSAYSLLYKDRDTTRALRYFDAELAKNSNTAVFPRAARYDLISNYYYFFTPDNATTAEKIDAALALFNTPELQKRYPRTYVGLLLFGGQIAYRLLQYSKANEYYFRAKKLADEYLDPCERASFHYNIAMLLYRQQNFEQSMNYFRQAYALQATCSPQTTAIVLQQQEIQSNIGLCLVELHRYDSALVYFDRALHIANQYRDSLGPAVMDKIYGVVYGNQARVAMAKGVLSEACDLSQKSITLNDRKNYEVENALSVKLLLAEVYSRQKDFVSMAGVLKKLQPVIAEFDPKYQLEWRRLKGAYFEHAGATDSALYFLRNYFSLRDSLFEQQKQLTAADVERQLREKEQQLQIAVLKKDQHITQISLWVTVVFAAMSLAIIYLVYQHYRRSKKSLAESLALNEEIRRQKAAREEEAKQRHKLVTESVIRAQEAERSLIGLELHDNVNQVLTTVKLYNEMLLEGLGDARQVLPRTITFLQQCINEIRSLSKRLSAPTLGKISLEESVNDLIESINATSKIKISRDLSGLENCSLKQEVHLGMYRILQEQLNNVLKHAEASEVTVQLEQKESNLRLCIIDNGKGFEVKQNKAGIGLMNMQTRAENLNGTFEVASQPGQGCRVEVVVPCLQ